MAMIATLRSMPCLKAVPIEVGREFFGLPKSPTDKEGIGMAPVLVATISALVGKQGTCLALEII